MKLVTASSGHRLLLIWRTEFLFYTAERRQLADEWNHVRLMSAHVPKRAGVLDHGLERPLPFPAESFDAIYCFHVAEHLSLPTNRRLMLDLHRLLKAGGTCRISTPDLEFLATEYLQCLRDQVGVNATDSYRRYQWALCNLIDQCVREHSGGEMGKLLERGDFEPEYIKHTNGDLLAIILPKTSAPPTKTRLDRLRENPVDFLRNIPRAIRHRLERRQLFELTHERNLWLFDRVSLDRLLSEAGFKSVTTKDHRTSSIPAWDRYNFDESAFGSYPLEPSLYMEGTK